MALVNPLNIGSIDIAAGAPPLMAFQIPVTDGLVAAHFLGHGAEVAKINFAPGGASRPGSFLGTPVEGTGYLELGLTNALVTDADETLACTLLATGKRKTTGQNVGLIGDYGGGSNIGASLYVSSGSAVPQANAGRTSGSGSVSTTGDMDTWTPVSVVMPATGAMTIRNHKTTNANNSTATADRVLNGSGKMRIGAVYSSSFTGLAQMNLGMIYNRALTTDEIAAMGAFALAYMALCGLS